MPRTTHVFGPAYLDRVLLVDRPLTPAGRPPMDQSVDGVLKFGDGLRIVDPTGAAMNVQLPDDWPGPCGEIQLSRPIGGVEEAVGIRWHDDLGGMGAGYAAALDGTLFSALGPGDDTMSRAVAELLAKATIQHRPMRVDRPADWTLLLTSGPYGDKLPIGFRGCHAALGSIADVAAHTGTCDLRVVASFPNRLAAEALRAPGAAVRMFAPAMRNMQDRELSVAAFADAIDILCCNRSEWESLDDREQVAWQVSVLVLTDGPNGAVVRFTTPTGEPGRLEVTAFPRSHPPRDTNRAGEAYASTFIATLLDSGWQGGVLPEEYAARAAGRAGAAAALVLDRVDFGFPSPQEIDDAIHAGCVGRPGDGPVVD